LEEFLDLQIGLGGKRVDTVEVYLGIAAIVHDQSLTHSRPIGKSGIYHGDWWTRSPA